VTANTSLAKGRDPRYLTEGAGTGHAGGTRYYSEAAGEPPGQWLGALAPVLNLDGDVDGDQLQALYMDRVAPDGQRLDARARPHFRPLQDREKAAVAAHLVAHPYATEGELAGVRAAERAKSQSAVPYFDFTVSAAKSVSVLHASLLVAARQAREDGADEDARELEVQARAITDALLASARAAVARVERALYVRTGPQGTEYRDAAGSVAAMFLQHTSREGDPQLHVHIAVMNLAQRGDQADVRWRTLHGAMLYQERLAVAAYAARELATRLTDLGYVLVPREDGNGFEVGGVPEAAKVMFSSRRAQITPEVARMAEEYRQRYGREPSRRTLWAMAQAATLETRKAKSRGRSDRSGQPARTAGDELDEWEARTTERELGTLSGVHEAVRSFARPEGLDAPAELDGPARARIIRRAVASAQRYAAAFTRAAVLWEVHLAMPAMAPGVDQAALAQELADEALASPEVLALGPAPDVVDVSALGTRASDGRSVFTDPGAERYTTAGQLDLEEWLLAEARREVAQLATPHAADVALAGAGLGADQAEVAAGLLTARAAVSVLVAPAGAGKTHVMAAYARAWTGITGGRVVGVTLSTNAANVMTTEGLAEAYNVAQALGRREDGSTGRQLELGVRDVVVIDEASQVCTGDLAALVALARRTGARLVLVGDTAQLGAVEAGGMMRLIGSDLGHWELAEVHRFDAEWEALASLQLRQGARAALRAYDARGRIRGADQAEAERDAVALYLTDHLMGRDSLLLAGTNEEAAKLAGMVRAELARLGRVPQRTEVTLADGNGAARGDLLRARENTRAVDAAGRRLTNRDTLRLEGVVQAAGGPVAVARRQLADGSWSRDFPVPLDYLQRSAELAYAGNVYVAQGRTVDTAHVFVDASLSRESLYVAMTRGREATTAHVVTGPAPARGQEPLAQADPLAVMAEVMDRTESAWTATEVMREAQAFATDTGHLLAMYSAATRTEAYAVIDAELQARLPADVYARYMGEEQRPILQRQVLAATMAGAPLAEVLDVATGRDFTGARSVAAVMHGRIDAAELGRQEGGRETGQRVTWAERVPEVITPQARALGVKLAEALDARAAELAQRQAEAPERWVLTTLGAFPAEGSEQLRADWLGRVGSAASYREAAGITDPNIVVGPAPQGHPELGEAHARAVSALEIPTEDAMVYAMTRGELEASTAEYERIAQHAPPEVSAELKAERTAELDARARGVNLEAAGQAEAGRAWQVRADAADVRATELEGKAEAYTAWEAEHRAERELAERARAELARRNAAERQVAAEASAPREPDVQAEPAPQEPSVQEPEVLEPVVDVPAPEEPVVVPPPEPQEPDVQAEPALQESVVEDLDVPDLEQTGKIPQFAAEEVTADPVGGEFPQASAGAHAEPTRIEDPELARAAAELDAHQAERQEAADVRAAELAERQEAQATREASREYEGAQVSAGAGSPSAWVQGPDTPSYGGPEATTAEPAPAAQAEAEAGL
jgi:conjugative relaxase-like TrwC/TraI family protein